MKPDDLLSDQLLDGEIIDEVDGPHRGDDETSTDEDSDFWEAIDLLEEWFLHLDVLLDRHSVIIPTIQRRLLEKLLDTTKEFLEDYTTLEAGR